MSLDVEEDLVDELIRKLYKLMDIEMVAGCFIRVDKEECVIQFILVH